jgi:hypothetical protein
LTANHEGTAPWPLKIDGYHDLAERELRKLEDADPHTTLPAAYVIARGFTAVTYAVLALRETYWDQAADLSNTLSRLADSAADLAETADRPSLRYRVPTWLTRLRGGTPEP